jgi:hypothetical protein
MKNSATDEHGREADRRSNDRVSEVLFVILVIVIWNLFVIWNL